jgi:hypothetical protein
VRDATAKRSAPKLASGVIYVAAGAIVAGASISWLLRLTGGTAVLVLTCVSLPAAFAGGLLLTLHAERAGAVISGRTGGPAPVKRSGRRRPEASAASGGARASRQ